MAANRPADRHAAQAINPDETPFPLLDNYGQFIGRLDTAAGKLMPRRDALSKALEAAELLFHQNYAGSELWGQRLSHVSQLLDRQAANHPAQANSTLGDLHDVSVKMQRLFGSRTQRVQQVCNMIRVRQEQINTSLLELEKSRAKLAASRMLAQERARLNKVAADLSMGTENIRLGFPDPGLQENLREAGEAIILAEALLEVKGS